MNLFVLFLLTFCLVGISTAILMNIITVSVIAALEQYEEKKRLKNE